MSTLAWIIVLGVAMTGIAMVGSTMLILSEEALDRLLIPSWLWPPDRYSVAPLFHMLPEAIDQLGNTQAVYVWFLGGFSTFFILEQCLHWHRCHRPGGPTPPLGHLILLADGLHNFIGGLAVAAHSSSTPVGIVTWPAPPPTKSPKNSATSASSSTAAGKTARHCCQRCVSGRHFSSEGWSPTPCLARSM